MRLEGNLAFAGQVFKEGWVVAKAQYYSLLHMAEFGVRYMVWLDGFTETSGRTGTISCTVGPGGAGCFGFGSWEDDSTFNARVWDVASLQNVGTISTDATGRSYVPALGGL